MNIINQGNIKKYIYTQKLKIFETNLFRLQY